MRGDVVVRDAVPEDAERLVEIYRHYVETTAITFEYDVPTVGEFRERMERTMEKYPYLVAEMDGYVVGYACAGRFVGRAAYDWSVETTIYLDRGMRGRGIGRRLYGALEEALKDMGVLNLNACIAYPEKEDEYLTRSWWESSASAAINSAAATT